MCVSVLPQKQSTPIIEVRMDEQTTTSEERGRRMFQKHSVPVKEYYYVMKDNITLFLGLILISSGILSFRSDRYCEGNPNDYYGCVNPATYYYYSTTTIVIIVMGVLMLAFWRLRKRG